MPINQVKKLNKLLPFVAIGTVADCQSILEPSNRLLVRSGLNLLQNEQYESFGLKELIKNTGLQAKIDQNYKLTSQDLGYILSPILNSSGRLSHAKLSIETLINQEKSEELALKLIQTNNDRKQMVKDILEEVELEAENQFLEGKKAIWLNGDWSKGIVGLLASRLVNHYNLPVVVVSKESIQEATASLRAPEGYNLPLAMKQLPEALFLKFGGHPGAAGFTCEIKNLAQIQEQLITSLGNQGEGLDLNEVSFIPQNYEFELPQKIQKLKSQKNLIWLKAEDLKKEFLDEVMSLDPFGQDFPFPEFIFPVESYGIKFLGEEQKHARIILKDNQITAFNLDKEVKKEFENLDYKILKRDSKIWVIAKISQNTWNGNTKNELVAEKLFLD